MNIAKVLERSALSLGDRPAVALGDAVLYDYRALAGRAAALAGGLRERFALAPGARVAIAMKNAPAYLETLYGVWWAGLAAVPMNAKLHAAEFAYMIEDSEAELVIATPDLAEAIAPKVEGLDFVRAVVEAGGADYEKLFSAEPAAMTPRGADDLAWLFYTSGTTGRPKGAMLTARNLMTMTLCYFSDVDAIAPGDSIIHAAPMSHGSGLYNLPHVAAGACQVFPESGGFDGEEFYGLLRYHEGVSAFFAPTMVTRLVSHRLAATADVTNLKSIIYGGGPMYVEDIKRAIATLGQKFIQIYGQGESPMTISALPRHLHADRDHPRYEDRLASVGRAMLACEVRIADEQDRDVAQGQTGEILVRGPSVMPGYWRNEEATAKTLKDGWLHTGDMGAMDEEGLITLKDRSKDVIISGGANIYPREVEEVLLTHPGVAECSVVGKSDADWGEVVVAFVAAAEGEAVDAETLDALCLEKIARFKRPKAYHFVDSLPKNNYGKILKTELREMLEG